MCDDERLVANASRSHSLARGFVDACQFELCKGTALLKFLPCTIDVKALPPSLSGGKPVRV